MKEIEILRALWAYEKPNYTEKEIRDAIEKAIKALENPSGDSISRKQVLDELMAHQYSQDFCKEHGIEYSINSSMVRIIVNGAQAVEPRPSGDCISREALKKQLKELLDLAVRRVNDTPNNSPCYRMYVEQENERARLIDLIDNAQAVELDESVIQEVLNKRCMTAVANEYLVDLHGKRPKGKWIEKEETPASVSYYCSNCETEGIPITPFCPWCGVDMRTEDK